MIIEYQQEEKHISDFVVYNYWASPRKKWFRLLNRISFPILIGVFFSYQLFNIEDSQVENSIYYFAAIAIILSVGFQFVVQKIVTQKTERQLLNALRSTYRDYFSTLKVRFEKKAIELSHTEFNTKVKWSDISHLEIADEYFFLYQNSSQALIIPKKAINNEHEFISYIEKRLNES